MHSWLKDIKGMWVATFTEGRMLGTVNGIYLDPQTKTVTGFLIRTGTPLAGKDQWVEIKNIKKVGVDLIFLPNENVLGQGEIHGKRFAQCLGMPVSTKDGRSLGIVSDMEVELETWTLTELDVGSGLSVSLDVEATVLGDDIILIQDGAQSGEREPERRKEGLVDSVLGKDFIKQTSEVLKRVLRGSEATLPKPKAKPSAPEPSDSENPTPPQNNQP